MIERALLTFALLAMSMLAYTHLSRRQLQRAGQIVDVDPLLRDLRPGVPAIVYFTTPTCGICHLQLRPMLRRLHTELGEAALNLIEVDAAQHPDTAQRWGVFSVPTTFILDRNGQPLAVYNGAVELYTLRQLLEAA